jgi:DNA (cytosine-5)-methyltransferase 1
MKYLSVCSGIEAATVAWHPLGWQPVAFGEIEKFPSQVLAHHYPDTPNWGDMTRFKEWPDADVNVFVGGTPCQSFSVAGLRKGLDDPRGNLMLTYLAIAARYRPQWLVWENVPGVLSSNGGLDFASLLRGMGECGYGFAYRILDAQYFGVAQRRRRVFVVGYLGNWRPAAAVLFERHSLSGHPAPSREKRQTVTGTITSSIGTGGVDINHPMVPAMHSELCPSLKARDAKGPSSDGDGDGAILVPMVQPIATHDVAGTTQITSPQNGNNPKSGDPCHPLAAGAHPPAIAAQMAVRRLTPKECERLQGFPDNYTDIKPKGKATPDGPRYKALGNSMAVPVMAWIGKRIQEVDAICQTQKQ